MNLTQCLLHPSRLERLRRETHLPPTMDLGYVVHAALAALFGKIEAPFKVGLKPRDDSLIEILFYTKESTDNLREKMTGAQPWLVEGVHSLVQKAMPTTWVPGQHVRFRVTACPQQNVTRHPGDTGPKRMDVAPPGCTREERIGHYKKWISERLSSTRGLNILAVEVDRSEPVTTYRNTHRLETGSHYRQVTFPSADFEGIVEVVNPDEFINIIAAGVGKQRGLGFGHISLFRP